MEYKIRNGKYAEMTKQRRTKTRKMMQVVVQRVNVTGRERADKVVQGAAREGVSCR